MENEEKKGANKITRRFAIAVYNMCRVGQFGKPISSKFRYMLSYNLAKTEPEYKATMDAYPPDPKFLEFISKRDGINKEFNVTTEADIAALPADVKPVYFKRHDELKEQYADAIAVAQNGTPEYNKFLDEEIELELRHVSIDDVPATILNPNDADIWSVLYQLIKD